MAFFPVSSFLVHRPHEAAFVACASSVVCDPTTSASVTPPYHHHNHHHHRYRHSASERSWSRVAIGARRPLFSVGASIDDDDDDDDDGVWISNEEARGLAAALDVAFPSAFDARYADAVVLTTDGASPSTRRVRPADLGRDVAVRSNDDDDAARRWSEIAEHATRANLRWCRSVVADLGLCPWARASVARPGAIRTRISPWWCRPENDDDDDPSRVLRAAVRYCAEEFSSRLDDDDDDDDAAVDPSAAITFVVAVPVRRVAPGGDVVAVDVASSFWPEELEFENFHETFDEVESDLYGATDDDDDDANAIGRSVTVAPFHPRWRYGSSDDDDDNDNVGNLDYEKRSPYPTISIVSTRAIMEGGGAESTARIAKHNEEVLLGMEESDLHKLFWEKVMRVKPNI